MRSIITPRLRLGRFAAPLLDPFVRLPPVRLSDERQTLGTPDVVEAIRGRTEVVSAREDRATFDEVFAILVHRSAQGETNEPGAFETPSAPEAADPTEGPHQ